MKRWSVPILLVVVFLAGCNSRNSVQLDSKKYGAIDFSGMTDAQIRFAKVKQIFVSNCNDCHNTFSSRVESDYALQTVGVGGDFLVTAGNLEKSAVWRVLRSVGKTNYMPPLPQPALEDFEITAIREWILNYGNP